jgi:hypothetical protein
LDLAPIALGWFAHTVRFEARHGLALLGRFQTKVAACFRFAIQLLRDRSRPSHFAQSKDFYLEFSTIILNFEHLAGVDFTGGLHELTMSPYPAKLTGA